jgi:hypothetical protein
MPYKDRDHKRKRDREGLRARWAALHGRRERETVAWHRKQLTDPDPPPEGMTLEEVQAWCRLVLSLPAVTECV